ncbi:MAG: hypothetical protein M0Q91_12620 [Methanoregula sp.]|jgi:NTP pyrophosphatase (non-canonical NTP hydrolase)|nr:hypothetical protein [Methanoregula sp.]
MTQTLPQENSKTIRISKENYEKLIRWKWPDCERNSDEPRDTLNDALTNLFGSEMLNGIDKSKYFNELVALRSRTPLDALEVLRPEVLHFALFMELKLRSHDHDRGDSYKNCDTDFLLARLREEVKELHDAVDEEYEKRGLLSASNVFGEAVDVANFAMFIGHPHAKGILEEQTERALIKLRREKEYTP